MSLRKYEILISRADNRLRRNLPAARRKRPCRTNTAPDKVLLPVGFKASARFDMFVAGGKESSGRTVMSLGQDKTKRRQGRAAEDFSCMGKGILYGSINASDSPQSKVGGKMSLRGRCGPDVQIKGDTMSKKMLRAAMAAVVLAGLSMAGVASATVTIETVPVGNVGNVTDPLTGYGSVGYSYNIGKYDVTATQYTAFLNAVAQTDTYGLYNTSMATATFPIFGCGITQSGTSGNYTYSITKNGNFPVNNVSFGDAMRFANWLQNGQPTGAQGPSTTEDGAYFVNGATTNAALQAVSRKSNWQWAVTSEDEWYKAAYYDPNKSGPGNAGFWQFSTKSDSAPSNVLSATGTNNANFDIDIYTEQVYSLTPVGAFVASPSAYGTFDQGGNVWQWNEAIISGVARGLRGGSFLDAVGCLRADDSHDSYPMIENALSGFRVSMNPATTVPLPASALTGSVGLLCMAFVRRMRRR